MPNYLRYLCSGVVVLFLMLPVGTSVAQDASCSLSQPAILPAGASHTIETLNVRDADLRDILRGIAAEYDINLIVDNAIDVRATVRLADLSVVDAVLFLCEQYRLQLSQSGPVLLINAPPLPDPEPLAISAVSGLLSVDLDDAPLTEVIRKISEATNRNIIIRHGVDGFVTGTLRDVAVEEGLRSLMENNGFTVRERDLGILTVDRSSHLREDDAGMSYGMFVNVRNGLIDLEVANAPVLEVINEIASQLSLKIVTYSSTDQAIRIIASGLSVDDAFSYILSGTDLGYRRQGDIFVIGQRQSSGISTVKLIRLRHARASNIAELIPSDLRQKAAVQLVSEQNGLLVQATGDVVREIEDFIAELDRRSPQILIEALVVDFEDLDELNIGFRFGLRDVDSLVARGHWRFGAGGSQDDGFSATARGRRIDRSIAPVRDMFGLGTIGQLPADFYMQIEALERAGKAKVLSRPQISTINGHPASISVGTTQYYILRTSSPLSPSGGQYYPIESERFEKVEAHVRLEVVPWVTESGDVSAEIRPEFSTPVGQLDSDVPPTINTRQLETTVRLRDGETIILGGLIQESRSTEQSMVPLLGRIPLIGRLFRSRRNIRRKSELVIYITPHVFYGDERDEMKWEGMRERLDLSDPRERGRIGYTIIEE